MNRQRMFIVALSVVILMFSTAWVQAAPAKTADKSAGVISEKEAFGKYAMPAKPIKDRPTDKPVDQNTCYACHYEIKDLKESGKHARNNNCVDCHDQTAAHLNDKDKQVKPVTRVGQETCGRCHTDQYLSMNASNLHRLVRSDKSLPMERSPNPLWDKLMMGHGFTKEHSGTRSHTFGLIDQFLADRTFGGRFQPKNGWEYVSMPGPLGAWDVMYDSQPDVKEHKAILPETAAAANPTCMQCKTQDQILKWKYLGDKDPRAKWDRTSNVLEFVKDLNNTMNCFICHDPHAAKPRIVRDALIQALTRPEKDTLWHKDQNATQFRVVEFRDGYRKIAILDRYDSVLQCGQCHVEYNCNPGFDIKTGEFSIRAADPRTNHYPFKGVFEMYDHYNELGFRDFRHTLSGALLLKLQHPEAETFWGSKHHQVGIGCVECHNPKVKNAKGKVYTSHWAASPKTALKGTCLTAECHPDLTPEQATYRIDTVRNYFKARMRKAEFWLAMLIDEIALARNAGVADNVLKAAQTQHDKAHILWEWWTAENSDGFHNPQAARESLAKSIVESKKGIQIIGEAMGKKAIAR